MANWSLTSRLGATYTHTKNSFDTPNAYSWSRDTAGIIALEGPFLASHRREILARVRVCETAEKAQHPMQRIMAIAGRGAEFALEYPCHSPSEQRWFVAKVNRFAEDGPVRVVVSRTRATVPNCPNWSVPSQPNYNNRSMSNFGCAVNSNLAAMVANPEDLVHGDFGHALVVAEGALALVARLATEMLADDAAGHDAAVSLGRVDVGDALTAAVGTAILVGR